MSDTISAIATARGTGGIAIVRISGPEASQILKKCFVSVRPISPNRLTYGKAVDEDGNMLDEVMAVFMPAPRTYTREDVVEIQCHGGDVSARRILSRVNRLGARPAGPGEFTRRAFLNGRIDLTEAEAVMQLIGARSESAARASLRQLTGGVSSFVNETVRKLTGILAAIEAADDYPDEMDEESTAEEVVSRLREIIAELRKRSDPSGARILNEGASVVLAGRPNVGKSSIMNALTHSDRAIVTDVPGTTRDVLTASLDLGGILVTLSDTAGRRGSADLIEQIGIDRGRRAQNGADIVLIVLDASEPLDENDLELLQSADSRTVILINKSDLPAALDENALMPYLKEAELLRVSAQTGEGLERLTERLIERLTRECNEESLTVERHLELVGHAVGTLETCVREIEDGLFLDIAAIRIKDALTALSGITGTDPTEAVIDRIFSTFCVGK